MKPPYRVLACSAILVMNLAADAPARALTPPSLTPEQHYQLGLEAQSHRDYAGMLHHLRKAASLGVIEAQENLGMALLVGESIYGHAVRSDRCEALQWFLKAARRGSELAAQHVHFLNRARNAKRGLATCEDK